LEKLYYYPVRKLSSWQIRLKIGDKPMPSAISLCFANKTCIQKLSKLHVALRRFLLPICYQTALQS